MKFSVLIGVLFCLFVASANAAVAMQWKVDLQKVSIAPGDLQPKLASRCQSETVPSDPDEEPGDPLNLSPDPQGGTTIAIPRTGEYQRCKQAAATGYCESGVYCTTEWCKRKDWPWKKCKTTYTTKSSFKCPNNTKIVYDCNNPCPVPAWAFLLAGISATMVFRLRQRVTHRA